MNKYVIDLDTLEIRQKKLDFKIYVMDMILT